MLSILSYITLLSAAPLDLILGFGDHFGILGLCEMGKKGIEGGTTTPGHCSGWRCGGLEVLVAFAPSLWVLLDKSPRGAAGWLQITAYCKRLQVLCLGLPYAVPHRRSPPSVGLAAVTQHPGTPPLSRLAAKANLDGGRILADPLSQF